MGAVVNASEPGQATYLLVERLDEAMLKCQYCASHNVRWFSPRRYADRAAVLLCMTCRRLTIVAPSARRAALAESQRAA